MNPAKDQPVLTHRWVCGDKRGVHVRRHRSHRLEQYRVVVRLDPGIAAMFTDWDGMLYWL